MKNLFTFLLTSFLAALGLQQTNHKKPTNHIPLELLFSNPEIAGVRISPDGLKISYLKSDSNNKLQVYVAPTDDFHNATQVTNDTNRSIIKYFWCHDNEHVLYLQDNDGNENWNLFQTNITTKETINLTPFEKVNVRILYYNSDHPDTIIISMNHENKELHDVYSVDLKTKKVTLVAKALPNTRSWIINHNLVPQFIEVANEGGTQTLLQKQDDSWQPFLTWETHDTLTSRALFLTKDNQHLYLLDSTDANSSQLIKINLKTLQKEILLSDSTYNVCDTIHEPKTFEILAAKFEKARDEWHILNPAIQDDFDTINSLHHGDFNLVSRTSDNSKWIIVFHQDNGPTPYFLYDRITKQANFLCHNKSKLLDYKLQPMHPISFQARDGLTIHGYITYPENMDNKKVPLVLNVHGGPWARDSWGYDPETQWLANRGYACLQLNYRGSTGYGKHFLNAGNKQWGKKMLDDLVDGVNWAKQNCDIDEKNIAIYGASYGGYAALCGATFTQGIFTCAVDLFGRSNVMSRFTSIPPYWKTFMAEQIKRIGNPETEADFIKSISPFYYADQIKIPLFIAHGANDARISQDESDNIVKELEKNNVPHQYLVFENEGHGFINQENRFHCFKEIEKFLAQHMNN